MAERPVIKSWWVRDLLSWPISFNFFITIP